MKLVSLAISCAVLATACTTARVDEAASPTITTTTTTMPVTTTVESTTTTTLPESAIDIVAWLNRYSAGQTLEETVAGWPGVESARYVGNPETLAEFQDLFADYPELVTEVDPASLPTSLRVKVSHPSLIAEVAAQLRALSDVAEVVTASSAFCDRFPGYAIVVFAHNDLELTRLRNQILAAPGIESLDIVGRDEALTEYRREFAAFPEVIDGVALTDMYVSLRAVASHRGGIAGLELALIEDPAVAGVYVPGPDAPPC